MDTGLSAGHSSLCHRLFVLWQKKPLQIAKSERFGDTGVFNEHVEESNRKTFGTAVASKAVRNINRSAEVLWKLNRNINSGRQIELHQRFHRSLRSIKDLDHALVDSHLELLP